MKNRTNRILSIVLTFVMLITLFPIQHLAAESHSFVIQPDGPGTPLLPTDVAIVKWETDFRPTEVKIGYVKDSVFNEVISISNPGQAAQQNIGYNAIEYTRNWVVRAYYDTDSYIDSEYFSFSLYSRQFYTEPLGGTATPTEAVSIGWSSNFNYKRAEVGYYDDDGFQVVVDTKPMLIYSNTDGKVYIGYSEAVTSDKWALRLYYNDTSYIESAKFKITKQPRRFSSSVSGEYVDPGKSIKVYWSGNFVPKSLELGYYEENTYHHVKSFTTTETDGAVEILRSFAVDSENWTLRAYYTDSDYFESSRFPVKVYGYEFVRSIYGDVLYPGDTYTMEWQTNYAPSSIEIGYYDEAGKYHSVHSNNNLETGINFGWYTFDYSSLVSSDDWVVIARFGKEIIYSNHFTMVKYEKTFRTTPKGGTAEPGQMLDISWITNFDPKKAEVGYLDEAGIFHEVASVDAPKMSSTVEVFYDDTVTSDNWIVRAYYSEEEYIESEAFSVEKADLLFLTQPEDDIVAPKGSAKVEWELNFKPAKIEVGYEKKGFWHVATTIKNPTKPEAVINDGIVQETIDTWKIRAFYNDNDYVDSEFFTLTKVGGYGSCGFDAEWLLQDGVLTISGTGEISNFLNNDYSRAPWYTMRDQITSIVIESGITGIGNNAFADCGNLTKITIPAEVSRIGIRALSNCTSLKKFEFTGDAPQIGEDAFRNDTMTLGYYPERSGWTTDVLQQYGGTITWVPLADSRNILTGANVTLGDAFGLNFYLDIPDEKVEAGAKVVMDGPNGIKTYLISDLPKDGAEYKATYSVNAIQTDGEVTLRIVDASDITMELYSTSGTSFADGKKSLSVDRYLIAALEYAGTSVADKEKIRATYTYCAYAIRWRRGTDLPSNGYVNAITEPSSRKLDQYKPVVTNTSSSITVTGYTLVMDSNMAIRLYFTAADGIGNHMVFRGNKMMVPVADGKKVNGLDEYYVEISNIGANKLQKSYTVVFDPNGENYMVTLSAMSYVRLVFKQRDAYPEICTQELCDLVTAIYAYAETFK